MINAVAAKRERGIDDLLKHHSIQLPEIERKVTSSKSIFQDLHDRFKDVLVEHAETEYKAPYLYGLGITEVLVPEDIKTFLQTTIIYENHPHYQSTLGRVASGLIKNSYKEGHTHFHLDFTNLPEPAYLLKHIYADYYRPLEVVVEGNIGYSFASHSANLKVIVNGNIGGDSAMFLKDSTMTLHGTISEFNFGYGGEHLVVKTSNEKTLMDVIQIGLQLPPSEAGISHVYLVKPDGSEKLVRYYNKLFPWTE